MAAPFNLLHSEAIFEPLANEIASGARFDGRSDVNGAANFYLARSRACFYLVALGIGFVCFASSTIVVVIGLALLALFGVDLPLNIRATMLMLRANQILSAE